MVRKSLGLLLALNIGTCAQRPSRQRAAVFDHQVPMACTSTILGHPMSQQDETSTEFRFRMHGAHVCIVYVGKDCKKGAAAEPSSQAIPEWQTLAFMS